MAFFEAEAIRIDLRDQGTAVLTIDVPGRTHNVFSRSVLSQLDHALSAVAADHSIRLLAIVSGKESGFVAGADVHEFADVRTPEQATEISATGQRVFQKLADLPIPTVAIVHGPCLGGGLEMAMACDYRVVVDRPSTQLGLPEIELGLLPGWGGTQRLPRLVGIERALKVILQRHRVSASAAFAWGLTDALAPDRSTALERVVAELGHSFRARGKRPASRLPLRSWRERLLESTSLGRWFFFRAAYRVVRRKTPDDMPAPAQALEAMRMGLKWGMNYGLEYERRAIGLLAMTKACRNLVTLFFLIEQAKKPSPPAAAEALGDGAAPFQLVGVIGAGTMGAGIAQLAAIKGFSVVVQEVNAEALGAGILKIEALFSKAIERGVLPKEEAQRRIAGVAGTTCWTDFDKADAVIEAVIEDLDLKRGIFRELEALARPGAVLATNTSSLSVGELQEGLKNPSRLAGLHFFNPVHRMPLVEVVRGPRTDARVLHALVRFAVALGKIPVVVGDGPGFVVNRVLMPYLNEAVLLAAEGMSVDRVDRTMRKFGMPMGPFELLDQIGLDVAAHIARTMEPHFGSRFAPNPVFERMVERKWLGQKADIGFYTYQGKKRKARGDIEAVFKGIGPETGSAGARRRTTANEARDRMVLLMVNEGADCLAAKVADVPQTVDLAMVLGTGWAPHRGGPLHYADDRGLKDVVGTLEDFRDLGPRFEPSAELRRRAEAGEAFYQDVSSLVAGS